MSSLVLVTGEEEPEEPYRPPLPVEDRLWRHPSEVAAAERAQAPLVTVTTLRTPLRHAAALATFGAIGGALVVSGLFLTLGTSTTASPDFATQPATETIALQPFLPISKSVPAETWPAAVVEGVAPGLATVHTTSRTGATSASAVVIRSDGFMLSSYDAVGSLDSVDVTLHDGSTHSAKVIGADPISGVAVLQVEHQDLVTARLAIPKPIPEVGAYAMAVPGPQSSTSLAMANISAVSVNVPIDKTRSLHGLLQLDGAMPSDASGGGLVDDTGAVVGIIVNVGKENATYAVPIGYARKIAVEVIRQGEPKHSWLGVRGVDLTTAEADDLGIDGAVRVRDVLLDSPAHRAGIEKGAIIVGLGGEPVDSMTGLVLALRLHAPDARVEVAFYKDGQKYHTTAQLQVRELEHTT